jgi:flagellar protein FlbD
MIEVTRINHTPLVINADLIEHLEATPDTVITMTTGQKLVVLETLEDLVERVIAFRRSICAGIAPCVCSGLISRAPFGPLPERGGREDHG